jgi:hypothetical protein
VVPTQTSNSSIISSICREDPFGRVSSRQSLFQMTRNASLTGTLVKRLTTSKLTKMSVPCTLNFSNISIVFLIPDFIYNLDGQSPKKKNNFTDYNTP